MKAYVLFHADIEDDRYVRAVFFSRELAKLEIFGDKTDPGPSH